MSYLPINVLRLLRPRYISVIVCPGASTIATQSESGRLFFLNADTGWIGTNDGIPDQNPARVLLETTDGGASRTTSCRSESDSSAIFSIFFRDANNGWFTADYGLIEHTGTSTAVASPGNNSPEDFWLGQDYPKPFNPSTVISHQLSAVSYVTLKVYDVLGREAATLVNERQSAGTHTVALNGAGLPSGVYFYRLISGSQIMTKKMILMK